MDQTLPRRPLFHPDASFRIDKQTPRIAFFG
jgi:hypothetical protein